MGLISLLKQFISIRGFLACIIMTEEKKDLNLFAKKVWITAGIIALLVILIFILKAAFNVLLMIFAGSLISVFFHGLADLVERKTKWKRSWSMAVGVLFTFLVIGTTFYLMGAKISQQASEMSKEVPALIDTAESKLKESSIGRKILYYVSGNNSQKLMNSFQQIFRTSFGVVGDVYIVFFIGLFFTVNPSMYKDGFVKLMPLAAKPGAVRVLDRISGTLKGWLKGAMLAMLIIAIFTFIGLKIIGMPMALALAVMAGLLNFIPNFGPLIAMIPAILIGLTIETNTAFIIALMYVGIQALESNVVTPMVQNAIIKIPPAMIIISQVLIGTLTGGLGIILATPLLAVIIVIIDELYVKNQAEAIRPAK